MSNAQQPITNLADYITEVNQLASRNRNHRYVYRGQKDASWPIRSGAVRRLQKDPLEHPDLLPDLFRGYLHQMIGEVQLRYAGVYHNLTALECMAHLQHNRVATGLIDFTYNPLVALWFACEAEEAADGKVFAVNTQSDKIREIKTRNALAEDLGRFFAADDQWHLWQPSIGNSALDIQRMTMQQSVFLFGMPELEPGMVERELLIPEGHKATLRHELDVMGISDQTLFSDLAGFFERNTTQSSYDRELAAGYYVEETRKSEGQGDG